MFDKYALQNVPANLVPLYKPMPPFMPFAEGHGYVGVVLMDKDSKKIQCHLCGRLFKSIAKHLYHVHDMDCKTYKEKVALGSKTPLVSPLTQDLQRHNYLDKTEEEKAAIRKRLLENSKNLKERGGYRNFKKKVVTVQEKNLYGTCDLQLKHRFFEAFLKSDRIPRVRELDKSLYSALLDRFASYEEALRAWGFSEKAINEHKESGAKNREEARLAAIKAGAKYTPEAIIKAVRVFIKKNDRLPTWGEFSDGTLPSRNTCLEVLKIRTKKQLAEAVGFDGEV